MARISRRFNFLLLLLLLLLVSIAVLISYQRKSSNSNHESQRTASLPSPHGNNGKNAVTKAEKPKSNIQEKLDNIIIDKIEFDEIHIQTAVKYLRAKSRELDPEGVGVNIVLLLPHHYSEEAQTEQTPDGTSIMCPTITMLVENIPLGEAIRYISRGANLKYRVEDYAVVIAAREILSDGLETRIYPMETEVFSRIANHDGDDGVSITIEVEEYFEFRNVSFPDGAKIVFDYRISSLIATNTADNLAKIERIIQYLTVVDPQVYIDVKYVKIAHNEFKRIKAEIENKTPDSMPASLWDAVLASDKTKILASSSVLTMNGHEATIRMTREEYFPLCWRGAESYTGNEESENKKNDDMTITLGGIPEFGDPTELGLVFIVTPTVDADNHSVDLCMSPRLQYHIGWNEFDISSSNIHYNARMPRLKSWWINNTAQVSIRDGETVCLGGNIEELREQNGILQERYNLMMLASIRLLNPNGTPIMVMEGDNIQGLDPKEEEGMDKPPKSESKFAKIMVNSFKVEDASILDAIKILNQHLLNSGHPENIILSLNEEQVAMVPPLNLDLDNIPLTEIIRYISLSTGLHYKIEEKAIIVGPESLWMERRFFKVPSSIISTIVPATAEEIWEIIASKQLREYFTERGVPFTAPETNIVYDRRIGKIIATNTLENLGRLETLLREMNVETPLVMIEMKMVELSDEAEKGVPRGYDLKKMEQIQPMLYDRLINAPGAKLLSAPCVLASSGTEANIDFISEEDYPECWVSPEVTITDEKILEVPGYPEFGETTGIGTKFSVMPVVYPNKSTALQMHLKYRTFHGWTEYKYMIGDGQNMTEKIVKMPIIENIDTITNVKIYGNEPILIGVMRQYPLYDLSPKNLSPNISWTRIFNTAEKEKKNMRNIYIFATVHLVNHK
jgi:type II secretory pathway component GspD/PulD (secretin)